MKFDHLNRREMLAILQALGALPLLQGCKVSSESETKDLTNYDKTTATTEARIQEVVQKYGMTSWVQQGGRQQEVFRQLSVVPDVYLEFLQKRANEVGFRIEFGGQAGGMCHFDSVGATLITLNSVEGATIHEVGHGVETFAHQLQGKGDGADLRDRTYAQVTSSAEAQNIRDYAKSNSKELWADGFSSFYRSPESRADMSNMPTTYQWLKSTLVVPPNLGAGENAGDYVGGQQPAQPQPQAPEGQAAQNGTVPPPQTPATTPGVQPVQPVQPIADTGGDICAAPADQLIAALCKISASLGSSGTSLTSVNQMILPTKDQFLTASNRFLFMARLALTKNEASRVKLMLGSTVIADGLKIDSYAGSESVYSTLFEVPKKLTPETGFHRRNLVVKLDDKVILQVPVRTSRFSLCGDIADFKAKT